jgi:gliding motility-associated-like protein
MRALLTFVILSFTNGIALSQMVRTGTATGACDCYTLTNNTNQAGSIWSPTTISLNNPFDFEFEVNLGVDDAFGADGMVFAMRSAGTAPGAIGNGMGYGGIVNSVGVEIDTWNSAPAVPTDIASDHLGMSSNGAVSHNLIAPVVIPNVEDGLYHTFRAVWNPITLQLQVYLDGTLYFTYTGNLVLLYFGGNPNVRFGWTGGTGGVDNLQSVCMYRTAAFSSDLVTACVDQLVTFTDASTSDLNYNSIEPRTWAWNFGDGGTSALQNPTHAYAATGTYTVTLTITDISGCSSTVTHTIEIIAGLSLTMSHTDVTCFGLDDGTGTAVPTTGTGPYTYLWDDPLAQVTSTSTGLSPAVYEVLVTDDLGCTGRGTVTILEPPLLVINSVLTTDVTCGLVNGTITIDAVGGTSPIEYSIDGGGSFSPSNVFIGLGATTYTIIVRDDNGCSTTTTATINLASPLVIDGVVTTDVSCGLIDDGTLTITASGGVPPFEYSIDGVTYVASNFFDFLSPGAYPVSVRDDAGCVISLLVTVNSSSLVSIDGIARIDVSCNGGADGEFSVTVSGGTSPYEYGLDGMVFGPSPTITGLVAGPYTLHVRDDVGCEATMAVTILEPDPVLIDAIVPNDVTCPGMIDGEITITVSGGTPVYEYSIDGGGVFAPTSVFTGLAPGIYPIQVRDDNGCLQTGTTTINEPTPLVIDFIDITNVTCNGLADGGVEVAASGGTTPYQYRVDGGIYQVSPIFTGLSGGTVTVEVMDDNGCLISEDVFLDEADPILLVMGPDTTICIGGEAVLCPTVSGGTAPYTYTWDGVVGPTCLTTALIGMYTLEVEDFNGCISDLLSQVVSEYAPLTALATSSMSICPGDPVTIAGEATGGGPGAFTYEWTNNIDATVLDGAVQTVNPTTTTVYTLTVGAGCESTSTTTVTITTYPVPEIVIIADKTEGCEDLEVKMESLTTEALVTSTRWELGDGSVATGIDVTHTYMDALCYDVMVDITTINGCEATATFTDYICVWQNPVADFTYLPNPPDIFHSEVSFTNESEFAITYEWNFGDDVTSGLENPIQTYPEIGNVTYIVELIAISDQGCRDTIEKRITVDEIITYFIPNAFTPNGDPYNSLFTPYFIPGFIPTDFQFMIFNRWGELIWESYDQHAGWDGTYNDILVDPGVYVWRLVYRENKTDKKYVDNGHVSVLR